MGAITFKDYNEEFLSEAQNSVSHWTKKLTTEA